MYRWRLALSAILVGGAVALAPFINVTEVDNGLRAWFARDDPAYQDYERFRAEFGGTQPLIVVIAVADPAAGDLFTHERLEVVARISREIEKVPSVFRVQSLATTTIVRAIPAEDQSGGEASAPDLEIQPLMTTVESRGPAAARDLALGDPLIAGELISKTATFTAVVVTFDEDALNRNRPAVLAQIHEVVNGALPPGLTAWFNGSIEISETYNHVTVANQRLFVPIVIAIIALAMYIVFRSAGRTLIVLFSILVSVVWTFGLYSLFGFGVNILTAMLAPLVIVLAISDDVHVIQQYDYHRRRAEAAEAFRSTLSYLLLPVVGASVTTAIGLLTLATSNIVAVREFGIGAALGVIVDMAVSIVLVPTLLARVRPDKRMPALELFLIDSLRKTAGFATSRPLVVVAAAAVIGLAAAFGIARLRVDTNHIGFFSPAHPLSQSARVIDRELAGVYTFHVFLEGASDSLSDPDVLQRIDRLSSALAGLPDVRKVVSLAAYVKRMHQTLHDGSPASAIVSADPSVIAQELFLFTMGDEGRRELERVATGDFSRGSVIVRLPSMSSDRVFERIRAADELTAQTFAGSAVTATVTGSGRLYSTLDHSLVQSQIASFSTAIVAVFIAFVVILRSIRLGVLALVPNLFPVAIVLGTMGWLDISLNVATVMVASVALGVVDDDTVHFMHRFRHQRQAGATIDEAVSLAAVIEGRAAATIAVVTSCGFAVLMLSEYKPSAWFGGLLALTMIVALATEILVLPAVLKLLAQSRRMRLSPAPPGPS